MTNLLQAVLLNLLLSAFMSWPQAMAQGSAELNGSWRAIVSEFEGQENHQLVGSVWVFAGDRLSSQIPGKGNAQYRLALDPKTNPRSFYLTPLGAPGEAAGWMIFSRQKDRLKLAFFDNLQGRPQGFGPQQNLAILTLVQSVTASNKTSRLCQVLQAANPTPLLGGVTEPLKLDAVSPGPSCGLQGFGGRIVLAVVEAPAGKVLFEERLILARRTSGYHTQMETGLGRSAYSIKHARGNRVDFVLLKGTTALMLAFDVQADGVGVRAFVKRVLRSYR